MNFRYDRGAVEFPRLRARLAAIGHAIGRRNARRGSEGAPRVGGPDGRRPAGGGSAPPAPGAKADDPGAIGWPRVHRRCRPAGGCPDSRVAVPALQSSKGLHFSDYIGK